MKVEAVHPSCYIDRAHANGSDAETTEALYLRFGLRSRFWWCQCRDECALRYIAVGNADGLGPADAGLRDHRLGKV